MRDLDSLVIQMIDCKLRYWRLFVRETGTPRFEASNFQQEDPTMTEAVDLLKATVSYYDNDPQTVFLLEMNTTNKGSSGSGKTDRIPFVANSERYTGEKQKSQLPSQINPLEGLQQTYSHATQVAGEIRQQENALNQRELDFRDRMNKKDIALMLREMELKRKEEDIKKKEDELKILEIEYTSHSQKVAKGVMSGVESILYGFVEKGMPGVVTPNPALAGVEAPPEQSEDERLKTVTGNLIESIATNAFEKMDADQVKAWGLLTEAFIQNPNDPKFFDFLEKARRLIIQKAA